MAAFLAALYSPQVSKIKLDGQTLSHCEVLLRHFCLDVKGDSEGFELPSSSLVGSDIILSGDEHETIWLVLLATLLPGSDLVICNAGLDSDAFALLSFLQSIGAEVALPSKSERGLYEGNVQACFAELKAFSLTSEQSYQFRDELPLLCVAAAYAKGESRLQGINILPYQYEDRVLALVDALKQMGVACRMENGELVIVGSVPVGGELDCAGDDKLALALLSIGARSQQVVKVNDCQKLLEEFNELESVTRQLGFHCQVTK